MTSDDEGGGGVRGYDDVINIFALAVILTASTVTITHDCQLFVSTPDRPMPSVTSIDKLATK